VEGGECGGPLVTVEVLSEDGDDEEDREEATNSTGIEDVVVEDAIEQFEGVTVSEMPNLLCTMLAAVRAPRMRRRRRAWVNKGRRA
jgi:hypothetical protein